MSTDLDRVLLEIKDLRHDLVERIKDGAEVSGDVDLLIAAVARTAYDCGMDCPAPSVEGTILATMEIAKRARDAKKRDERVLESLRANVMARRNAPGGCCDWSCPLCVVLSEEE